MHLLKAYLFDLGCSACWRFYSASALHCQLL